MFIKAILSFGVVFATLTFVPQVNLTGIKCVVEGERAALQSAAVKYKDGMVFLCNDRCVETFKKDLESAADAKFTTKANHQLVLTGQYVQKGCPVTGKPVDEIFSVTVSAVKVGFSCADCRAKITDLKTIEEKVELLFSDAAFEKAFGPKEIKLALAKSAKNEAVQETMK